MHHQILAVPLIATQPGDLIIIAAFAQVHEDQVANHVPQLVFVDSNNRQTELRYQVPIQLGE